MQILALVLVGLYALLNLFLAVAGHFHGPARQVPLTTTLLPTALFAIVGVLLGAAIVTRHTWLVAIGLVLGSIAPILYGALVERENVWLHHGVRAVFAVGIMVVWLVAFQNQTAPESA